MRLRVATALLALSLPAFAQVQTPSANEAIFYKAFYLEKGERDFPGAMSLYEQFLTTAPSSPLAKVAAQNNLNLLQRTGKGKEAEEFAQKYDKLLGGVAVPAPAERPAAGDNPRGEGRGQGGAGQGGQRGQRGNMTPEQIQERLKSLKDDLAKAKESGDTDAAARLERQIARLENPQAGGQRGQGGQGGQGGPGGRRGFQPPKFAEMSKEQLDEFKTTGLERMSRMVEMTRERSGDEAAKKLEDAIAEVKKNLDAGKIDEAQKAYDKLRESMPGRGRRGGGGGGGN